MAQPNSSVVMNAKRPPNIPEVHILWSPDGLGCDGDTISTTAATLPSIEDIVLGTIPGLPKVHLHNRVLAAENGDEYMEAWYAAAYLGWTWTSKAGLPVVNVAGCPVQPDNMTETLLYLLYHIAGLAPIIPLDINLRPTWLFGKTVHEGCDRAGYYEQADFAHEYGSPKCLVKLGCWGPVVNCNVTKRGWMDGIGGCPNVGGICIACTMPGFPDKVTPFMDEPPGGAVSSMLVSVYGRLIRSMRGITNSSVNREPKWRRPGAELLSGYEPTTY